MVSPLPTRRRKSLGSSGRAHHTHAAFPDHNPRDTQAQELLAQKVPKLFLEPAGLIPRSILCTVDYIGGEHTEVQLELGSMPTSGPSKGEAELEVMEKGIGHGW